MHLKPYLIDLSICLTAISTKLYASITGLDLTTGYWTIDKIIYVLVMLITGVTTLYRFVKEVRTDKQTKAKKEAEEKNEGKL